MGLLYLKGHTVHKMGGETIMGSSRLLQSMSRYTPDIISFDVVI